MEIKSTSKLIYNKALARIEDKFGDFDESNLDLIAEKIIKCDLSDNTKVIYLCAILKIFSGVQDDLIKKYLKQLREDRENKRVPEKIADYEIIKENATKHINLMRQCKMPCEILSKQLYNIALKALLSMLYLTNPRRMEYRLCTFSATSSNYYDIESKKFIFNDYKTFKSHGMQEVTVSQELHDLILAMRNYHAKRRKDIRTMLNGEEDFVIKNSVGNKFDTCAFNAILKQTLGGSVCFLRRSYISECYKTVPNYIEMKDRAIKMGHSIDTALKHYKQN